MIVETDKLINEIKEISDIKNIFENKSPFSKYLIYYINNEIVGFCYYYEMYEKLDIEYIFVIKKYRRNHIGSELLKYLINNNLDKDNISLEVRIDNVNAINLYKKQGFEKVAIREKYYDGVDGILMVKFLNE